MFERDAREPILESAKAAHYPTLDLNASYGKSEIEGLGPGSAGLASSSGNGTRTEGVISLSLNAPLYRGGGTQASVRRLRSLLAAADQTLLTVQRNVRVNTRSLFRQVNTNIESASALE